MILPEDLFQLDAICHQFEQAWKESPTPPELNGFLTNAEASHRPALFKLLLPIDVEYRKRRSLAHDSGQYAGQFPEFASLISEIVDSVDTVSIEQDLSVSGAADVDDGVAPTIDFQSVQRRRHSGHRSDSRSDDTRYCKNLAKADWELSTVRRTRRCRSR